MEYDEPAFADTLAGMTRVAECNHEGSYEGSGAAIAKDAAGKYWTAEYSHFPLCKKCARRCSCYGPARGMSGPDGPFDTYEDARRNVGVYEAEDLPATEPGL